MINLHFKSTCNYKIYNFRFTCTGQLTIYELNQEDKCFVGLVFAGLHDAVGVVSVDVQCRHPVSL